MTLSLTVWARCRLEQCSSAGDLMERRPRLDLTETIVDIRYILSTMNQNRTRELKEREFSQYYFDRPERFSVLNCMCCLEHFPSWRGKKDSSVHIRYLGYWFYGSCGLQLLADRKHLWHTDARTTGPCYRAFISSACLTVRQTDSR